MSALNKRERVQAVANGRPPDHTPSGFWLHFPAGCEYGPRAVDAHMRFFEESETDLCKVMNENSLPDDPAIRTAADWSRFGAISPQSPNIERQLELVRAVCERVDRQAVVLATVHGLVATASHALGGVALYDIDKQMLVRHLRENRAGMEHAFEQITQYLIHLSVESVRAGADGIYFASLGAERDMYSDEEFAAVIKPYELRILEAVKDVPVFNVLHMCKDSLNLERYAGYPGEVINWGVWEDNISLLEGDALLPGRILLGGLDDRSGVLVDGDEPAIAREVHRVLDEVGQRPFILGADCTLPTEIDPSRIRAAVRAAAEYRG